MKNIILGVVAIVLFLSVGSVFAKERSGGKPFDEIWDAIDKLENRISNIQITPVPRGEQGLPGKSLKLVDGNGQKLGQVIDVRSNGGAVIAYLPDADVIIEYWQTADGSGLAGATLEGSPVYFLGEDCTGVPIVSDPLLFQGIASGGGKFYKRASDFPETVSVKSVFARGSNEECINLPESYITGTLVKEIPLPIVMPLKFPLRIIQ